MLTEERNKKKSQLYMMCVCMIQTNRQYQPASTNAYTLGIDEFSIILWFLCCLPTKPFIVHSGTMQNIANRLFSSHFSCWRQIVLFPYFFMIVIQIEMYFMLFYFFNSYRSINTAKTTKTLMFNSCRVFN